MGDDARKLFVGQLPMDILEEEVRTVFTTYGAVADVKVIDGKPPGSQKCAFVTYETESAARAAMQVLHDVYRFRTDSEKPIRVTVARGRASGGGDRDRGDRDYDRGDRDYRQSDRDHRERDRDHRPAPREQREHRDRDRGDWDRGRPAQAWDGDRGEEDLRKVFVGQLPLDIREDEVRLIFNTYGQVTDVKIIDGKPPGSQKCAFVGYETEQGAKAAIQVLNDVYKFRPEAEKPIRVEYCRGKGGGSSAGGGSSRAETSSRGEHRGHDWGGRSDRDWGGGGGGGGGRSGGRDDWSGGGNSSSRQGHGGGSWEGGSGRADDDLRKVFVGNLPGDIREDEVKLIFNTYGQVTDVKIIDGKPPGVQKCAFVSYETEQGAKAAIQVLHNVYKFRVEAEKPIRVEYTRGAGGGGGRERDAGRERERERDGGGRGREDSGGRGGGRDAWGGDWGSSGGGGRQAVGWDGGGGGRGSRADDEGESRKVFVGQLPVDITEDEVTMVFKTYGEVTNVHIIEGKPPGSNKVAFVEYLDPESAKRSISALNDEYRFRRSSEQPIRVSIARPKNRDKGGDKGGGKGGDRGGGWSSGGGGQDWGSRGRSDWDRGGDRTESYGKHGGGSRHETPYSRREDSGGDRRSSAGRGDSDRGHASSLNGRSESWGGGGKGGDRGGKGARGGRDDPDRPPGPKLHIGNLPSDISKDALETVFGTYGRINDVHVMQRSDHDQCAAFVTYENEGDARKCVAAMEQGYEIRPGQGNIHVSYAKEKRGDRTGSRYQPY